MDMNLPQDPNSSQPQADPQQPTNSYVDSYQPPQVNDSPVPPTTLEDSTAHYQTDLAQPAPVVESSPTAPSASMSAAPLASDAPASVTPSVAQPAPDTAMEDLPSENQAASESLEDQNIFFLLGVQDGTEEEKEAFLDELQQVIWEDFLESDVELLITQEEQVELKKLMDKTDVSEDQKQEEIVTYLEKLIPDLEEIMLEKALQLKEDMVKERIAGMREYFEGQSDKLAIIDEADSLIQNDKWRQAADKLNNMMPSAE